MSIIDRTVTAAGARLLGAKAREPARRSGAINARLDAVSFLAGDTAQRDRLRRLLAEVPDLARALARLALLRGGPRDLAGDARQRRRGGEARGNLREDEAAGGACRSHRRLRLGQTRARGANSKTRLPTSCRSRRSAGGFVRAGYDKDLDAASELRDESRRVIASLQTRYAEETGIRALKIKHNNVLGYFIEVAAPHGEKLMTPPLARDASFTARRSPAPCAFPRPNWPISKAASRAPRTGRSRSSSRSSIASRARCWRRRKSSRRSPTRSRASMSRRRSPNSR